MKSETVIVLDIETTGLSPERHAITEVAAVKVKGGKIIDSYQTLINPQRPIPKFITRLTGINDSMVENAPLFEDVVQEMKEFFGDAVLIGHNVSFDYRFLTHNFAKHTGEPLSNPTLCTAKLARRMLPDLPNKKLGTVAEHYDVINDAAHRAMGDVQATTKILNYMVDELTNNGFVSLDEIKNFETFSCAKAQSCLRK